MSELQDRLDEAYDWIWEARGHLANAMEWMRAGNYEKAQHLVAEAEDLVDDADKVLKTAVGP